MEPTAPTTASTPWTEVRRSDWLHETKGIRTRLQILVHIPEGDFWKTVVLRYGESLNPVDVDEIEAKALKRIRRRYGITIAKTAAGTIIRTAATSGPRESKYGIDASLTKDEKRKLRRAARAEARKAA